MPAKNSRLNPGRIRKHAKKRFKTLNPLQEFVVERLVEKSRTKSIVFTRGAVNYILREIEDPDILHKITDPEANDTLGQLLNVAIEHAQKWQLTVADKAKLKQHYETEEMILLSFSSILQALHVFDCPKPWC